MKKNHVSLIACLLFSFANTYAQDIKFAGSHPPNPEVLQLLDKYGKAMANWKTVAERDSLRKALVSPGYFYHGHDGAPIDLEGMTKRQTSNGLQMTEFRYFDITLHQYQNSALVTYQNYTKGTNAGEPFAHYGSAMVVISREKGVWLITADMIGRAPAVVKDPAASEKKVRN